MDYYLWVTIGVAAGIAIVIFLIVHFATKTSFVMGVMAVNTDGEHIEATGPDYFTDFLREHGVISKRDVVNLNYTIWIDPNSDSDVDSTNLSTIQVLFMTRSVDVFFSDEEFLKLMGGTDYLADLRDYLGFKQVQTFIFSTLSTVARSVNMMPPFSSSGRPFGNQSSITKYSHSSAFTNGAT